PFVALREPSSEAPTSGRELCGRAPSARLERRPLELAEVFTTTLGRDIRLRRPPWRLIRAGMKSRRPVQPVPAQRARDDRLVARGCWGRLELQLLLLDAAGPAEEQERERDADPGEDGDGEEGGLEAFGQRDQPAGAGVRCQVVVGAGDGDGGDDRDAERRPD